MIIDHIEGFEIDENERDMFEAKMALARLGEGLHFISEYVKDKEKKYSREYLKKGVEQDIVVDIPAGGLLSNMFHWYAVSLCNYGLLVGYLKYSDAKKAKEYRREVMPRIVDYRNKTAAHFSYADPKPQDNLADRYGSLLTQIVFVKGYYLAGALSLKIESDGDVIEISRPLNWSISKNFIKMKKRYWPNGPIKSYGSIKLEAGETKEISVSWDYLNI